MSKNTSIIIFSLIAITIVATHLSALEIYIAPITYIDTKEETVISRMEISKEMRTETEKILYGKKIFLKEIRNEELNAPVSIIDAIKVSRDERADYLLYGFIEKKEYIYSAEIRFLDFGKRAISKIFYSTDDIENYERLIKDLSCKIVSYLDTIFDFGLREEKSGKFILSIPLSFGYWSYLSSDWRNTITGTGSISTGLNLITNDRRIYSLNHRSYLSWNLNIEYRYGIGKDDVELKDMHILTLSFPIRVHVESLSKEGGIFFGFGFLYDFNLANIEETYIGDKQTLYTHMGALGSFGYQGRISKRMRIAFDNIVDIGFQSRPMISYSPRIRMLYCIYTKEIINKWK